MNRIDYKNYKKYITKESFKRVIFDKYVSRNALKDKLQLI